MGHLQVWLDELVLQDFWVDTLFSHDIGHLVSFDQLVHVPVDHHRRKEIGRHNLPVMLILLVIRQILDDLLRLANALSECSRVVSLFSCLSEDLFQLLLDDFDELYSLVFNVL